MMSMQRKSFGQMVCPIARSLERVGEWWSILILRDALHGLTRFDQFQRSLGIAPNILTRRLNALVEAGLLERRRYSERPPRYEYVLTARGRDFRPVVVALFAWGNKHFAPEGASVLLVNTKTGNAVDPILVDRATGRPLLAGTIATLAIVVTAAWVTYSYRQGDAAASVAPAALPQVVVSKPLEREVDSRLGFLGQFSAVEQLELRAQVGGTLTGIHLRMGTSSIKAISSSP